MRGEAPRRAIPPYTSSSSSHNLQLLFRNDLVLPYLQPHRSPSTPLAGIPHQPALCRPPPPLVPGYRRAPPQLSHPAQLLTGESSACIMENVSGERAARLRNLTNIRLATLGLSLHPSHRLAEP